MLGKVFKRISQKRPRGRKLILAVGILSATIWLAAIAAFFLAKGKAGEVHEGDSLASHQEGHGGPDHASGEEGATRHPDPEAAAESEQDGSEHGADAAHPQEGAHSGSHAGVGAHSGEAHHAEAHKAGADHGQGAESNAEAGAETGTEDPEGAVSATQPTREEAEALKQVAELFVASGNMEKAVTPMRRVMRLPTRDADLLSLAADIFQATGNYREAFSAAQQVIGLRPDDMRARVLAVEAQYRLGEVEKAFSAAHAAIRKHPGELAMLTALGTMEVEMGPGHHDYGKSLAAALKLKPDYVPALYLSGRKSQLEGNYKDAEAAFRKVVGQEPGNAKAHGQLGMALYHLGRESEAEKEYRLELGMNPLDYNTWFNLGELQSARATREYLPASIQSLRAEAMESYLKALELNPDHAQAHYRVGVLLNGNGQYKEAIRHLEASLKTDSRHVPSLVQLSLAFENLKQPERARAYLTKAYEIDPLNKVVLFKLKQWSLADPAG